MFKDHTQTLKLYGIFTYIYPKNDPNVGKYSIHAASRIYPVFFGWNPTVFLLFAPSSFGDCASWQHFAFSQKVRPKVLIIPKKSFSCAGFSRFNPFNPIVVCLQSFCWFPSTSSFVVIVNVNTGLEQYPVWFIKQIPPNSVFICYWEWVSANFFLAQNFEISSPIPSSLPKLSNFHYFSQCWSHISIFIYIYLYIYIYISIYLYIYISIYLYIYISICFLVMIVTNRKIQLTFQLQHLIMYIIADATNSGIIQSGAP